MSATSLFTARNFFPNHKFPKKKPQAISALAPSLSAAPLPWELAASSAGSSSVLGFQQQTIGSKLRLLALPCVFFNRLFIGAVFSLILATLTLPAAHALIPAARVLRAMPLDLGNPRILNPLFAPEQIAQRAALAAQRLDFARENLQRLKLQQDQQASRSPYLASAAKPSHAMKEALREKNAATRAAWLRAPQEAVSEIGKATWRNFTGWSVPLGASNVLGQTAFSFLTTGSVDRKLGFGLVSPISALLIGSAGLPPHGAYILAGLAAGAAVNLGLATIQGTAEGLYTGVKHSATATRAARFDLNRSTIARLQGASAAQHWEQEGDGQTLKRKYATAAAQEEVERRNKFSALLDQTVANQVKSLRTAQRSLPMRLATGLTYLLPRIFPYSFNWGKMLIERHALQARPLLNSPVFLRAWVTQGLGQAYRHYKLGDAKSLQKVKEYHGALLTLTQHQQKRAALLQQNEKRLPPTEPTPHSFLQPLAQPPTQLLPLLVSAASQLKHQELQKSLALTDLVAIATHMKLLKTQALKTAYDTSQGRALAPEDVRTDQAAKTELRELEARYAAKKLTIWNYRQHLLPAQHSNATPAAPLVDVHVNPFLPVIARPFAPIRPPSRDMATQTPFMEQHWR